MGVGVSSTPSAFTLEKRPDIRCVGVWLSTRGRFEHVQKTSPLTGFDPLTFRIVASRYN
jgi:hypothetical protein